MTPLTDDTLEVVFDHIFTGPLFGMNRHSSTSPYWKSVEDNHILHLSPSHELVKTAIVWKNGHTQFQFYIHGLIWKETRYIWNETIGIVITLCDIGNYEYVLSLTTDQFSLYLSDKFLHGTRFHLPALRKTYTPGVPDEYEFVDQYGVHDGKPDWNESAPEYITVIPPSLLKLPYIDRGKELAFGCK
jgi:hypothetical protein